MFENDPIAQAIEQSSIKIYHWSELQKLPKRQYLIKGLLDKGSMSDLFGPSNSGKTFVALDIALHIALGWPWSGLKTRQGKVVYIAGEGGIGVQERLEAFKLHHALEEYPDFYLIPKNIALRGEDARPFDLIDAIKQIGGVELLVIDTLARAMAGGNENASEDMGELIQNCDHIRHETGAHVMVIHHTGKDIERGARGHSSLKAAIDTELSVSQSNGVITVYNSKQRDGKKDSCWKFKLKSYEVGTDEDGDPITSCVLIETNQTGNGLSRQNRKVLEILQAEMITNGQECVPCPDMEPVKCLQTGQIDFVRKFSGITKSDKPDNVRRILKRALNELENAGYITVSEDFLWFPDKPDKTGQIDFPTN